MAKLTKKELETRRRKSAQRRRRREEAKWQLNGLEKPIDPKLAIGTKGFHKLQQEWYAKLVAKGHQDIEWATNPNSDFLVNPASKGRAYSPGKQLYFAMARNFLTHFRFTSRIEKRAWTMHTEGEPYRDILTALKREFGVKKSIYWLYYYVVDTKEKCFKWNKNNPEGLFYGQMDDGSEYGMQLDAGFWENIPKPF